MPGTTRFPNPVRINPRPSNTARQGSRPVIDPECQVDGWQPVKGEKGDKGDPGPKGDKGDPGTVTDEQLAAIVTAVVQQLEQSDQLRGPAGPPGEPGPPGPPGGDAEVDIDALVDCVIAKLHPIRIMFHDEAGWAATGLDAADVQEALPGGMIHVPPQSLSMHIEDSGGQVRHVGTASRRLGEPVKLMNRKPE